jgi:hypothetical protein
MRNDYNIRPRLKMKKGGKAFPDLSGDGKTTFKDVLIGRGVIKKNKKADMLTAKMSKSKKGKIMKGKR